MTYFRTEAHSKITVHNYTALRRVWGTLDPLAKSLTGAIVVERPLTAKQLSRIPKELRAKL